MVAADRNAAAKWYAVYTKPRHESRAEANLGSLGVSTLCPRINVWRVPRGSARPGRDRIEPLFPQYVFVHCDIETWARQIQNTRGVVRIVGTTGAALPIDPDVIDMITSRVGTDGFVEIASRFQHGDPIRVTSGPLRDLVGMFDRYLEPSERVAILLTAASASIHAIVDRSALCAS